MSAPPYMKLYVADYLGDTHHLGALEHGAYLLLLMAMWRAGGKLPANDAKLARIARCTDQQWAEIRDEVLAFFTRAGGSLKHRRLTKELSKYEGVVEKRKEAGKQGGMKTASKNKTSDAASATANDTAKDRQKPTKPEPEPEPVEEDAEASFVGSVAPTEQLDLISEEARSGSARAEPWTRDAAFAELWTLAPKTMRTRSKSKDQVWPHWRTATKRWTGAQIIAAMGAYLGGDPDVARTGGPGLHIWLRDGKCEHWIGQAPDVTAAPATAWTGPADIWAAVEAIDASLAVGFLARCRWTDVPRRALVTTSGTVSDRLHRDAGRRLAELGVEIRLEHAA